MGWNPSEEVTEKISPATPQGKWGFLVSKPSERNPRQKPLVAYCGHVCTPQTTIRHLQLSRPPKLPAHRKKFFKRSWLSACTMVRPCVELKYREGEEISPRRKARKMVKHANLLFIALLFGMVGILSAGTAIAMKEIVFMIPTVIGVTVAILSSRRFDRLTATN